MTSYISLHGGPQDGTTLDLTSMSTAQTIVFLIDEGNGPDVSMTQHVYERDEDRFIYQGTR